MTPPSDEDLARRRRALSAAKRALVEQRLRGVRRARPAVAEVPHPAGEGPAPMSFAQRRLWVLHQMAESPFAYNIPGVIRLAPPLDPSALEASLNVVVARHDSLRTSFDTTTADLRQQVAQELQVPLDVLDLRALRSEERGAAAGHAVRDHERTIFDLSCPPLLRASLLWLDDTTQLLLLTIHHLVVDGWSMGVLFRELNAAYEALIHGRSLVLPPPAVQYPDYARWLERWASSDEARAHERWWRDRLAGLCAVDLPADRPYPAIPSTQGAQQARLLSPSVSSAIRALVRAEGATLFMGVLAALASVLARYSGQEDIAVGAPVAGRTRVEFEGAVGLFFNTIVLRIDLSGNPSFREVLRRARETSLEAFTHQELPFERVVDAARPAHEPGRPPLFQVFFNLLDSVDERLAAAPFIADTHAPFDLSLYCGEGGASIPLALVYRTDLFTHATAGRMLAHLAVVLETAAAHPDTPLAALPLTTGVAAVIRPDHPFDPFPREDVEQSIPARFRRQALAHPARIAVRSRAAVWTYGELACHRDSVAALVHGRGMPREGRVGLLFGHEPAMIAALLGTLAAGKAYVTLDAEDPDERLAHILDDSDAEVILTNAAHAARARALAKGARPVIVLDAPATDGSVAHSAATDLDPVPPDRLAYLLYTSGSTGRPKGVMQSHRNVLGNIRAYTNALHIAPDDRLALVASTSVDAAVMDIFGALLNGAALCMLDVRRGGLDDLSSWLDSQRITIYHSTPTLYRQLMASSPAGLTFPSLRLIVLGGEETVRRDFELFKGRFAPTCLFVNGMGPTESTLALQQLLDRSATVTRSTVPVGLPVEGVEVALLDATGAEIDGVGIGEIEIRGEHVALGYWRRAEETRAVFSADPGHPRRRRYRTGDIGRRLADGRLEFVGRRDTQVKIRGHRVELGEIESLLASHPAVCEAAVTVHTASPGGARLIGYLVFEPTAPCDAAAIQRYLQQRLPAYMVPSIIVPMGALPRTASAKVDRLRLPPPGDEGKVRAEVTPPRTPEEAALVEIWREILGVDRVDVDDDFFALGGHSLLATQMISRVRTSLGVELGLRQIFSTPRLAELARVIVESRARGEAAAAPAIAPLPRRGRHPRATGRSAARGWTDRAVGLAGTDDGDPGTDRPDPRAQRGSRR